MPHRRSRRPERSRRAGRGADCLAHCSFRRGAWIGANRRGGLICATLPACLPQGPSRAIRSASRGRRPPGERTPTPSPMPTGSVAFHRPPWLMCDSRRGRSFCVRSRARRGGRHHCCIFARLSGEKGPRRETAHQSPPAQINSTVYLAVDPDRLAASCRGTRYRGLAVVVGVSLGDQPPAVGVAAQTAGVRRRLFCEIPVIPRTRPSCSVRDECPRGVEALADCPQGGHDAGGGIELRQDALDAPRRR
jgi:hypothetical protein